MISEKRRAAIQKGIDNHHSGRKVQSQEWLDEAHRVLKTGKPSGNFPVLGRKK